MLDSQVVLAPSGEGESGRVTWGRTVFAVGQPEVPGQRKTVMALHCWISCAVEPQVILALEEWRAKLPGGEKGWRGQAADHEEWQNEGQRWRERQASETLWASGCLSEQSQWKTPLTLNAVVG